MYTLARAFHQRPSDWISGLNDLERIAIDTAAVEIVGPIEKQAQDDAVRWAERKAKRGRRF